jgi:hypothetical protein
VLSEGVGKRCETCYGEGQVPTDAGLTTCPDCGGSGTLATPATLIEWRMREIERDLRARNDETAMDVRWLVFELRRARDALLELLALADDLDETPIRTRMRFIASGALDYYQATAAEPAPPDK